MAIDPHLVKSEISPYTTMQLANALSNKGLSFDLDKTHTNSPFHWLNEIQDSMKNIEAQKAVRYLDQLSQDPDKLIQMRNAHSINGDDMYEAYKKQLGNYANFVFGSQSKDNKDAMEGKRAGTYTTLEKAIKDRFNNQVADNVRNQLVSDSVETMLNKQGITNTTSAERNTLLGTLDSKYKQALKPQFLRFFDQWLKDNNMSREQAIYDPNAQRGFQSWLADNFKFTPGIQASQWTLKDMFDEIDANPANAMKTMNDVESAKYMQDLLNSDASLDEQLSQWRYSQYNQGKIPTPESELNTLTQFAKNKLNRALANPELTKKLKEIGNSVMGTSDPTVRSSYYGSYLKELNQIYDYLDSLLGNKTSFLSARELTPMLTKHYTDVQEAYTEFDKVLNDLSNVDQYLTANGISYNREIFKNLDKQVDLKGTREFDFATLLTNYAKATGLYNKLLDAHNIYGKSVFNSLAKALASDKGSTIDPKDYYKDGKFQLDKFDKEVVKGNNDFAKMGLSQMVTILEALNRDKIIDHNKKNPIFLNEKVKEAKKRQ